MPYIYNFNEISSDQCDQVPELEHSQSSLDEKVKKASSAIDQTPSVSSISKESNLIGRALRYFASPI
jgi:hypothetical protein